VVGVSYWEAEAFCEWAGGRLPTEQEWEAAARGTDGHEYPWGDHWEDNICNTVEAGFAVATPVGIFPRSRSKPFGLDDMAGNVYEWCQSEIGIRLQVFRGGCWWLDARRCRAAYRIASGPQYQWNYLGFRVAAAVPVRKPSTRPSTSEQAEPRA